MYRVTIPAKWAGYAGAKILLESLSRAGLLASPQEIVWQETEEGIEIECASDDEEADSKVWSEHFRVERS